PFYMEAEFWVGLAFVLAVAGLFKPVVSAIRKLLRARSAEIELRLKEAVDLKENAQKLLAEYERKFRHAEKEALEILTRSEREIEAIKKETLSRLEADMENREREAKARLKAAEDKAANDVILQTTNLTLDIVKNILAEKADKKLLDKLIDNSIQNLKKIS
ncbi:MAG: F0F1 ATP synthase subunit B, partial [Alphaproteobacteria bacterium]|nr:F0F1 ATP synthase subunit B [Alphaproteobacteria bacterium]